MNTYAILNDAGHLICFQEAERAHEALALVKKDYWKKAIGSKAKPATAILKSEWEKGDRLAGTWLRKAARVEA